MRVSFNIRKEDRNSSTEVETDGMTIDLSGRGIQNIDLREISRLPHLKELDLSHNRMSDVSLHQIRQLDQLEKLDLSHNELESIDLEDIQYCSRMSMLNLAYNHLRTLWDPDIFEHLNSLEELHLNNNFLKYFDLGDLEKCTNLRSLSLARNELKDLKLGHLSKCKELRILDFRENLIRETHIGPLIGCRKLKELLAPLSTRLMIHVSLEGSEMPEAMDMLLENERVEWVEYYALNVMGAKYTDVTVSFGKLGTEPKDLIENNVIEAERLWLDGEFENGIQFARWGDIQSELIGMAEWSGLTEEQIGKGLYHYWRPSSCDSPEDMLDSEGDWYGTESGYRDFLNSVIKKYGTVIWGDECIPLEGMSTDERLFFDSLISARRVLRLKQIRKILSVISSRVKTRIDSLARASGLRFSSVMSILSEYTYPRKNYSESWWRFPFLKVKGSITNEKVFICDNPDLEREPEVHVESEDVRVVYLVICQHCGNKNEMGKTTCDKCGASL